MDIIIGEFIANILLFDSRSEAVQAVSKCEKGYKQLGDDYYGRPVYAIRFTHYLNETRFGLVVYTDSIPPSMMQLTDQTVLIGYNRNVICVDMEEGTVLFEQDLMGYFFYARRYESKIVIVTEIGVEIISINGKAIRRIPTDLIKKYQFTERLLICCTESGIVKIGLT